MYTTNKKGEWQGCIWKWGIPPNGNFTRWINGCLGTVYILDKPTIELLNHGGWTIRTLVKQPITRIFGMARNYSPKTNHDIHHFSGSVGTSFLNIQSLRDILGEKHSKCAKHLGKRFCWYPNFSVYFPIHLIFSRFPKKINRPYGCWSISPTFDSNSSCQSLGAPEIDADDTSRAIFTAASHLFLFYTTRFLLVKHNFGCWLTPQNLCWYLL